MPAALDVADLSKRFSGITVLSRVSLEVAPGEVHALLGGNGSGKSTLIKVLSGYHRPEPGSQVRVGGRELHFGSPHAAYRLGCRFVHQDGGLVDELSVTDNLALTAGYPRRWGTIRDRAARHSARAALAELGLAIDPAIRVGDLPSASRTEVAVVRALRKDEHAPVRLLVLDEPTATLPVKEVRQLLDTVRRVAAQGVAVLYVSHRLQEAFDVADRVTILRDGQKIATEPIGALSHDRLVAFITGEEPPGGTAGRPAGSAGVMSSASPRRAPMRGKPLFTVTSLRAAPLRDLSFTAGSGEIVGLAGITGSGRESVLGAVFGVTGRSGTIVAGERAVPPLRPDLAISAGIAHLPADRKKQSGLTELTATENLTLVNLAPFWRKGWLWHSREAAETRTWVEQLGVRPSAAGAKPLSTFSGGNQQKILFAKWLRCRPRVLLLDEPTQGVDVGAKAEIHRLIEASADEGAAVVVSSTDFEELAAVCHRVLVLHEGRLAAELPRAELSAASISRYVLGTPAEAA
jgi:ribose transport system ATP-binding protein